MPSEEPRLEEQAISRVVHAGLSSQLDDAEELSVDIRTDLGKAAQGKVDSVSVSGKGVTLQNIRVQTLELQTDRVTLNPLDALFGNLKLSHPVDAIARVVLTEADVNQAVNAPAIAARIPSLELNVEGEQVTVKLQHPLTVALPETGKIALTGKAALSSRAASRQVEFSVVIIPRTGDRSVSMAAFQCQPEGLTIDFIIALMQIFKTLLELPFIEIEGMAVRIKRLDVQAGHLTVETEAYIPDMPSL
ncbi:MAG: DUF2993 domain-containing protein [Verrucomicrobia bacterium]|nr:DUF2993 domain-containing protein [Leptolyngbya sp. ES-bin-22]